MSKSTEPKTVEAVGSLLDREGVTPACEAIEGWAREGRWADLATLAATLEERCPETGAAREQFEEVLDHLEDTVALGPGDDAIATALELSLRERRRSVVVPRDRATRIRALASRLGYGHSPAEFLAALDRAGEHPDYRELFACWMHEVVLRGVSLAMEVRSIRFQAALRAANHPLGTMPLELRLIEREAPSYMPLYGDKGLGRAIDALASGAISVRSIPPPADGAAVRATRVDDASMIEQMIAAVRPWGEGKSGKVEARLFTLQPAVEAPALGSWLLRALPLDATTATARIECSQIAASGVFGPLFSAASNGGAYSAGLGGAYGRLAAWTSLGALAGAPAGADIEAVDAAASRCAFLAFRAPGPWFHDVAWDLGVVALRPGGTSVAVLAATDAE